MLVAIRLGDGAGDASDASEKEHRKEHVFDTRVRGTDQSQSAATRGKTYHILVHRKQYKLNGDRKCFDVLLTNELNIQYRYKLLLITVKLMIKVGKCT